VLDGEFNLGGDNIFSVPDIESAETETLDAGIRFEEGHRYVIGTDTAMGSDEMVHSVLDVTNLIIKRIGTSWKIESGQAILVRQMASRGNSKSPQKHMNDFLDLFYSYKSGDNMGHMLETWNGESARFYQDLPSEVQIVTKCYGSWQPERRKTDNTNKERPKNQAIKKADIIISLQKLFYAKAIKIHKNDPNRHPDGADLSQQLFIYKEDDKGLPTDRVISLSLAAWLATEGNTFQTSIKAIDW